MDILICLCIVFILLIIHTIWPKYVYDPQYEKFKVVDVLKNPPDTELNTGDIVFVNNCAKCKYTDDQMNNMFQYVYRNMFNSFRWYGQGNAPYTHAAVILRLNVDGISKPYICHIDGGEPMYDERRREYIAGVGPVVSSMHHINIRGGEVHLYKYKGPRIDNDMTSWVIKNKNIKYPNSIYKLAMVNGLKWDKNPDGVMACTDFVENTLHHIGILDKKFISGQSTINDVVKIVRTHDHYNHIPIVLKNKCYDAKHFR